MVSPVRFGELVERDQEHHHKTKHCFVTFQSLISFLLNVSNSYKDSRLLMQSKLAAKTKNCPLLAAEQNRRIVPALAVVL